MVVSRTHRWRKATLVWGALMMCATAALAQDLGTAAKVMVAQGRVSVLRNREKWALSASNSVRVGEIIETGVDGYAQLQVSDGSSFEVFPESRVVFRANPGNLKELVEVFLGKVKVYIQHFGGRPNPYRVHSPTAVISVRGTVFEVSVEADTVTSVTVVEGLVEVAHRLWPGKVIQVAPGEYLKVYPNAPLAQSGVNRAGVAAKVAAAVRDTLYSLPRRTGGGRAPSGGAGGGVPTDTPAPAPPPPPPSDQQAPAPPPPPQ